MDQQQSMTDDIFGPVIYSYTRKQAIEDGVLVDVTETAKECGFKFPVALTRAVWEDCVAWDDADNERQTYQDESGRLWDVLWMLFVAIKSSRGNDAQILYKLRRVSRNGRDHMAREVTLKCHIGPGDDGEPVITIMFPNED